MSLPPVVVATSQGLSLAAGLSYAHSAEREGRIEETIFQPIAQMFESSFATSLVNSTLQTLNQNSVPSSYGWVAFLLPPALFLLEKSLGEGQAKDLAGFFKDRLGLSFQAIALTTQIALVYFTGSAVAIGMLSYLTMDLLHQQALLPKRISAIYASAQLPLCLLASALSAGTLAKSAMWAVGFATDGAIGYCTWRAAKAVFGASADPKKNLGRLTPEIFEKFQKKTAELEISLDHLYWAHLPPIPLVDLSDFLSEWDRTPQNLQGNSPKETRRQLVENIRKMKHSSALVVYHAKMALEQLQQGSGSAEERAKFLIALAKPPHDDDDLPAFLQGWFDGILKKKSPALRDSILHELQQSRTRNVTRSDSTMAPIIRFFRFLGFPNQFVASTGILSTKMEQQCADVMRSTFPRDKLQEFLQDMNYTATSIATIAQNDVSDFKERALDWWEHFLQIQSPEAKATFAQRGIPEKPSEITEPMLLAMLFEMGIIQIVK